MSDPIAINDASYLSGRTVFPGGRWRPTLTLVLWSKTKGSLAVACLCTELAFMPSCRTVVLSKRFTDRANRATDRAAELMSYEPSCRANRATDRAVELMSFYHRG
ncbi:hypothetical protein AAC387_Pa12g1001 [Persea americana]